ncbi:MFS transporter [Telluribacter sp. SYSU D00476]|uniref:MFS transporter n=1 Tax=Telluribacter sp. SYSU D00476 TaxID=2811430 RepID=UPI001FF5D450|nr:MFS transporter [Telluribacter sp. SYSU D00476]
MNPTYKTTPLSSPSYADIKGIIDNRSLSWLQYTTIFVCFLMNMLDGMDVLIISYTAPSIASEWAISSEMLGMVFSAGVMGMAVGAMFLAPKTDIIGRKSMILICAVLMGGSIFATAYAQSITQLSIFRFISGLGIGSMLASTSALASEYAPNRTKDFWVSLVISGYPMGAFLSGLVAAEVIPTYGWRTMYIVAGIASVVTIPLIYFMLAESLDFLFKTRPKNALQKCNHIMGKMGLDHLSQMPEVKLEARKASSFSSLFTDGRKTGTIGLWVAFFMSFVTLYFLTSWIPKLAASTGLSLELAIYSGTVFNMGSFAGILTQGYLSGKFGLRKVIGTFLIMTALLMFTFSAFSGSVLVLVLFGLIGFCIQGGFVGLYSVAARMYPTEVRTTGIGWAIGAGRIGALVGPLLGGVLIGMNVSTTTNFILFAIPAIVAGIATYVIRSKDVS